VAKRADWPFVVQAGDRRVYALGTSFVVRRDKEQLAVTLVEGKVTVTPDTQFQSQRRMDQAIPHEAASSGAFTLTPGQRLTFAAGKETQVDTPSLDKAIAWRQGHVVLDDTPLSSAVSEMNRYNSVKLVVERPEAKTLLVNGLFQVGDSVSFAKAVAKTYGLAVTERPHEIVLSGTPTLGTHPSP
jgi:transmembrane sensor